MKSKRLIARLGILGLLLFAMVQISFGQGKTVTGKITSNKDGSPVANASVVVKGKSKGTNTDANGNFTLAADIYIVLSPPGKNMPATEVSGNY